MSWRTWFGRVPPARALHIPPALTLDAPVARTATRLARLQAVPPASSKPHARLAFSLVYPDRSGRPTLRAIGQVLPPGPRRGEDDAKTLHAVNFQTGDYLNVAIM